MAFAKPKAEHLEPISLESGTREAATVAFAWLLLATLAQFARSEFEVFESGKPEFGRSEFGRPEAEPWEPTCLESGTQVVAAIGFAWLLLASFAQFAKLGFEASEFEKQEFGMPRFAKLEAAWCELICLELAIQAVAMIGLAWSLLGKFGTLARFAEFEVLEFARTVRWRLVCLESAAGGAGKTEQLGTLAEFGNAGFGDLEFGKRE